MVKCFRQKTLQTQMASQANSTKYLRRLKKKKSLFGTNTPRKQKYRKYFSIHYVKSFGVFAVDELLPRVLIARNVLVCFSKF